MIASCGAAKILVVHHHQNAVLGLLDIQFNIICAGINGIGKSIQRVLRGIGRKSPVRHNHRIAVELEPQRCASGKYAVDIGEIQRKRGHCQAGCDEERSAPAEWPGRAFGICNGFRENNFRHLGAALFQERRNMRHADGRGKEGKAPQYQLEQQL